LKIGLDTRNRSLTVAAHHAGSGAARISKRSARWLLLFCGAMFACSAVETRFWQQEDQSDFEKGRLNQLSLRSDGHLFLAPELRELFDSATPYLWAIAVDSKGTLYVGGGGSGSRSAKVFAIEPSGKSRVVAELEGLEVHSIAIDHKDRLFAATSPDGKVYEITPGDGKARLFYDPRAKYIWAMAFDSKNNLYVATGDHGELHRVTPDGKGSVFFSTEETHARSLAIDAKDDVIVGTEPGGLVVRISPAGQGFVLYQAPKREITAVAVGPDGAIYAAGVGNKMAAGPVTITALAPGVPGVGNPSAPPSLSPAPVPSPIVGGSDLYRIDPDGAPRKLWSHPQDIVYAIALDQEGRPLLGTGNRGKIYRLDGNQLSTLLLDAAPTQITGFAMGKQQALYAITGNIGKVFQIGPKLAPAGSYESDVFDAGSFSYWGRMAYRAERLHPQPTPARLAFSTRSGNLGRAESNWSPWVAPARDSLDMPACASCGGGRVASPAARFLQYKVDISAAEAGTELSSVEFAYLPKNIAPEVSGIDVAPPNYRFPGAPAASPGNSGPPLTLTIAAMGQHSSASTSSETGTSQTLAYAKGSLSIRWMASDENGDTLAYNVEIRGVNESQWKPLKDRVHEKYLSFDSTAFPDGEYVVRVTATDAPSNPPDQALTASLVSDPFLIDNTPPQILSLTATRAGNGLDVQWKARDGRSNVDKAEYSLNGGEWLLVEPVTKLFDSPEENFRLHLEAGSGEQVIAVRVADEFGNLVTEKVVVR
jgi:sugar lactone lactonase YvrE